ncbi:unnamed protein product [Linum trigynum]|uniref:Uncharacterized protein n=1 Tax=Linum trigynum TaxID=586398 RepID=A0AAV2GC78_9ROSI
MGWSIWRRGRGWTWWHPQTGDEEKNGGLVRRSATLDLGMELPAASLSNRPEPLLISRVRKEAGEEEADGRLAHRSASATLDLGLERPTASLSSQPEPRRLISSLGFARRKVKRCEVGSTLGLPLSSQRKNSSRK